MKSIAHLKQTYVRPDVPNTWWNRLAINFIVIPLAALLHACIQIGEKLDPITAPLKAIVEPRIRRIGNVLFPDVPSDEQDLVFLIIMAATGLGLAAMMM